MRDLAWRRSPLLQTGFVTGILICVALLAWFGFRSSREWQQSASLLVERRADEAANLFATALARDMRAVQSDILVARAWDGFHVNLSYDVTTLVASAFARYPYPDSFFAIDAGSKGTNAVFFMRSDRPAAWSQVRPNTLRYPVRTENAPSVAHSFEEMLDADSTAGRSWSVFETAIDGRPYQVVARLDYADGLNRRLEAIYGFTVDLNWVRQHYYADLARQVERISGTTPGLTLAILDDSNATVASTADAQLLGHLTRRSFPAMFIDPRVVALNPPRHLPSRTWTILVSSGTDPTLLTAIEGARWTFVLASGAAMTLALGLLLSARAIRAWGSLAEMRAEFMSSVTHELKTPIAAIQALAQTFAGGRVAFLDAQREYGSLILRETRQLARLVDNLLAHARITDVADVYSFEALDVEVLLREASVTLTQQLRQAAISLEIEVDPDLPPVHADSAAMALLLDNLLDNAIRYSGNSRRIRMSAVRAGSVASIQIADEGVGIAPDDIGRVVQKFVRARNAPPGGSGLGLAIVKRIVGDHHGRLLIDSTLNLGTVVTVEIPFTVEDEATRHSARRRA
jgi:signal transduction histidine kinase